MRSAAEQEIRDAVVARLRKLRPLARICHEVNSAVFGPTRMDVVAISKAEIIAVEIKSEKDKMSRAPRQIEFMAKCSSHQIIALHECHLVEKITNEHAAEYGRLDGKHYLREAPPEAKGACVWVYPERERRQYDWDTGLWRSPNERYESALPSSAIHLLWRDELYALCGSLRVAVAKRANMDEMVRALLWHATGKELTLGICAALRKRSFAEADSIITEPVLEAAE